MDLAGGQRRGIYTCYKLFYTTSTWIWRKCNLKANAESVTIVLLNCFLLEITKKAHLYHNSSITNQQKQIYTYFWVYALSCFSLVLNVMDEYIFCAAFYHCHSQILRTGDVLLLKHFRDTTMKHVTDFSIKGYFIHQYILLPQMHVYESLWLCFVQSNAGKRQMQKKKSSLL